MSNIKHKKLVDIKQRDSLLLSIIHLRTDESSDDFHVEDIAIKNKELFPGFFTWSKYREHIDLRQVMRTLDSLKRENLVIGSNVSSWTLTKKGVLYAEELNKFDIVGMKKFRQGSDYFKRELKRILLSEAYLKFSQNKSDEISEIDLRYLFRVDSYNSDNESIRRNKEKLYKSCIDNEFITSFLDQMSVQLEKRLHKNKE